MVKAVINAAAIPARYPRDMVFLPGFPVTGQAADTFRFFTPLEAAVVVALVDTLIPKDDVGPGGVEVGVPIFNRSRIGWRLWPRRAYVSRWTVRPRYAAA